MPLARTPPRIAGAGTSRAHTFSPSQAYPDGVVPSEPEPESSRSRSQSRSRSRTPASAPTSQPRRQSTSRRWEQNVEEAVMDEELEQDPSPSPADPVEEGSGEGSVEKGEEAGEGSQVDEEGHDDPQARQDEVDSDVEMDEEVHPPPPRTPPTRSSRAPSQPAITPGRTPRAPRASYHPVDPLSPDDPSEPAAPRTPRTPRDRRMSRARTPAEVVSEPPVPIRDTDEAEYGKYYETLARALRINTIDKGLSKLTLDHMRSCYPLLAEEKPESVRDVWANMLHQLRSDSLSGAHKLLDDYRVPKRLRTLAQVVDEANSWKEAQPEEGRPDAWRPDLTPFTISTGTNLEVYDQSWSELREEYMALTKECDDRMRVVQEKMAKLANVDDGVSDSVVELAKTNKLLEGFPSAEMLDWAERAGARA